MGRVGLMILGSLSFAVLISQISAECLCGASGLDLCSCNKFVPQPKMLSPPPNPMPHLLPPVGDKCYCAKQMVQPAHPPKAPCCPKELPQPPKPACGCTGGPLLPFPFHPHKPAHHHPLPPPPPPALPHLPQAPPLPYLPPAPLKLPGCPADPVSIGLAYQLGETNKISVPESTIQYGFKGIPLNGLKCISVSNIPEEKLYMLNKGIIELKKKKLEKPEEEIIEEDSDEDFGPHPGYLSYAELGYGPEKFKSAKFQCAMNSHHYCPGHPPPPPPCDCGCKSPSKDPYLAHF